LYCLLSSSSQYLYHTGADSPTTFDTKTGLAISRQLTETATAFNLSRIFGYAPQSYYLNRFPYTHPRSLARFLTHDVFPALIRNESRPHPPLTVVNTGSTRFDISEGPFTVDSQCVDKDAPSSVLSANRYLVLPFLNRNVFVGTSLAHAQRGSQPVQIRDVPRTLASVLVPNLHGEPGDEDLRSSTYTHAAALAEAYEQSIATTERLSYGYVTLDRCEDAGGAGDDVRHRPVPSYRLPEYVGTDLPAGELVDVAFFVRCCTRYGLSTPLHMRTGLYRTRRTVRVLRPRCSRPCLMADAQADPQSTSERARLHHRRHRALQQRDVEHDLG
jgi:hypothetical protein